MGDQRLHLFTALEVAEELALRDGEMLRRITPEEITNGAWMDDKNVGLCDYCVRLCCECYCRSYNMPVLHGGFLQLLIIMRLLYTGGLRPQL